MKRRAALLVVSFLLPLGLAANWQDESATIKVNVRLVEVYATIFDHKGRYVDGLGRESFQVLEDGTPQRIATFETNEENISCAILLDTTGSMREALPRVKNSVVKLIDELNPSDSVAIFTFAERVVVRQDFTKDKADAKRAVLRTRAEGGTALFDAISETADELSKRPGKKALVVFTDGDDNSSILNANAAVTRARTLGVPLYSVAEGQATHSAKLRKLLEELSQRTGGAAYEVKKPSDIDTVFHTIADDLRHLYMMSYKPSAANLDGKWRKIDLQVEGRKDYRVRAKEGYFPD
jgi:VWFA-related protein